MKRRHLLTLVATLALTGVLAACGKKEEPPVPKTEAVKPPEAVTVKIGQNLKRRPGLSSCAW